MDILTTVTSKGQVTIPIQYRQMLGLGAGSKVKFAPSLDNKKVLILQPVTDFSLLKGYFKSPKKYSKEKAREAYLKEVVAGKV